MNDVKEIVKGWISMDDWMECDENPELEIMYVGSVLSISPSGKYWTSFAEEIEADVDFWDTLDEELSEYNVYYQSGADPLDIFLYRERTFLNLDPLFGHVRYIYPSDYSGESYEVHKDFITIEDRLVAISKERVDEFDLSGTFNL